MSVVNSKWYVREVLFNNTEYVKVVLTPVTRSTEDNVQWARYTPSGEMWMNVYNGPRGTTSPAVAAFMDAWQHGLDIDVPFQIPDAPAV